MAKTVTTSSADGFASTSSIDGDEVFIDATGEETPDTLDHLLATYAACYVPALRVGGQQRGVDELGALEIAVTGDLNDDDKLEAISFDVTIETDVDEEAATAIIDRANELCKVHDALKSSLEASVSLNGYTR